MHPRKETASPGRLLGPDLLVRDVLRETLIVLALIVPHRVDCIHALIVFVFVLIAFTH